MVRERRQIKSAKSSTSQPRQGSANHSMSRQCDSRDRQVQPRETITAVCGSWEENQGDSRRHQGAFRGTQHYAVVTSRRPVFFGEKSNFFPGFEVRMVKEFVERVSTGGGCPLFEGTPPSARQKARSSGRDETFSAAVRLFGADCGHGRSGRGSPAMSGMRFRADRPSSG